LAKGYEVVANELRPIANSIEEVADDSSGVETRSADIERHRTALHRASLSAPVQALLRANLGAAVDFLVEDEDMLEVARWVMKNTPFDRLYVYRADRPIHLSFSSQPNRSAFLMRQNRPGSYTPAKFS